MDRRTFVTTTGATLASIAVAGCLGGDDGTPTDGDFDPGALQGDVGQDVDDSVEVVSTTAYDTGDDVGVTGVIENVDDEPLSSVEVEVTLRDGDTIVGEFVDTSEEEILYLGPGNRWRFWVTFEDEDITGATDFVVNVEATVAEGVDWWDETPSGGTPTGGGTETATDGG